MAQNTCPIPQSSYSLDTWLMYLVIGRVPYGKDVEIRRVDPSKVWQIWWARENLPPGVRVKAEFCGRPPFLHRMERDNTYEHSALIKMLEPCIVYQYAHHRKKKSPHIPNPPMERNFVYACLTDEEFNKYRT